MCDRFWSVLRGEIVDGKVQAERIADCNECAACEGVCPTDAILRHSAW